MQQSHQIFGLHHGLYSVFQNMEFVQVASRAVQRAALKAEKEAMKLLILRLHREFLDIKTILGHRDLPGMQKACPCFDATKLQPLLAS